MNDSDIEESDNGGVFVQSSSKKRKVLGRMREVAKKIRVQSHEQGSDCKCKKKCFDKIPFEVRDSIISQFNMLDNTNEQNSYLCGLISLLPVQRRRPRVDIENANLKDVTCKYKVRGVLEGVATEFDVCRKAFSAIHGVSKKKIEYLINSLKMSGMSPKDQRGKHLNRKHKLSEEKVRLIKEHIESFNGRGAHYCLKDSKKKYLPEDLNVSKMFKLFKVANPNIELSIDSYRNIFNTCYNISFGYPRTDTCSFCDQMHVKKQSLENDLKNTASEDEKKEVEIKIRTADTELKLHKLKAEKFYDLKRKARLAAKKTDSVEAICIDFGKNLCVPNVTTNDVYYKRQLSVFCFNVHILSNSKSVFYLYPESEGKKGSDDVSQMLFHFLNTHLPQNVENLHIFADSCGGQNKNTTVFRFLHYMVHVQKRFKSVQVTFPIRGHSYMENDKNMALIKQNFRAELPYEWAPHIRDSRQRPSPFIVEEIDHRFWRKWSEFLNFTYAKKLTIKIRPLREIKFTQTSERLMYYRNNFSGAWEQTVITLPKRRRFAVEPTSLPDSSYEEPLPVSSEKYKDLRELVKFCSNIAADRFFSNLKHSDSPKTRKK